MYKLRKLEEKDLEVIAEWCNGPELIFLFDLPFQYINFDIAVQKLESYIDYKGRGVCCAVVLESTDDILGIASITSVNYINQSAEFHVKMGNDERHEVEAFAVKAMLNHIFFNMHLRRIEVMILEDEKVEMHIYQEYGFRYEGRKRRAYYNKGKFFNILCYAILKEEYAGRYSEGITKFGIPDYCMALSESKDEIHRIIEMCDNAFPIPVCNRENSEELIAKFSAAAKFIYAYSNTVMGYVAMYCNDLEGFVAYISLIGVKPEFQNRHIGTALMNACIQIAKSKGMNSIQLEVKKNNVKAIQFYIKHGFNKILEKNKESWIFQKDLMKGIDR